jgi:alkylhydroperoxidase family enzyme
MASPGPEPTSTESGPRLAPTTADQRDPETNTLIDSLGGLNIFTTLAHHPKALESWLRFGGHVLAGNSIPEREREMVILRAGWRCRSDYEFGQHTVIGLRAGLTDDEVRRLAHRGRFGLVRKRFDIGTSRRRTGRRAPDHRSDLGLARG